MIIFSSKIIAKWLPLKYIHYQLFYKYFGLQKYLKSKIMLAPQFVEYTLVTVIKTALSTT